MLIIAGIVVFVIVVLALGGWITQNVATANQAAATLEVARAVTASQTNITILTAALVFSVVVSLIAIIFAAVLIVRLRMRDSGSAGGKWVSGPNANFGRLPAGAAGVDVNTLIALMVLKQLGESKSAPASLPEPDRSFDQVVDDWNWTK